MSVEVCELGRAKSVETRESILTAASKLFLKDGFAATSLDVVATEAGVTKPTIYSHFRSKEGLLSAVIDLQAKRRAGHLEQVLSETGDPREDLLRFGEQFTQRILSPEARTWQRFAVSEARDNPDIGKAFIKAGPARVLKAMAEYFRRQTEQGVLQVDDPAMAAELFVSMMLGLDMIQTQIGGAGSGRAHRKNRIATGVDLFLANYSNE
ncbi:MAG: TetR/AcrR family transcriptional regulator [Planctomycetota bacterium]